MTEKLIAMVYEDRLYGDLRIKDRIVIKNTKEERKHLLEWNLTGELADDVDIDEVLQEEDDFINGFSDSISLPLNHRDEDLPSEEGIQLFTKEEVLERAKRDYEENVEEFEKLFLE